ncbi:hypothetical protein [Streptomyces termitum]|uniref:hypothetical protein n=1 Tax=Streptomyces termitum TaxID=67368 RepID=UPI0037A954D9
MRTALRTALATAFVAGVVLTTPVLTAGAAFAADGPAAAASAEAKPAAEAAPGAGTAGEAAPGAAGDAAKGTLVRTETLLDGTIAKIYEVGPAHHRAELFSQGAPAGVFDAVTRPVAGNDNGTFFVLFEDGRTFNWDRNYLPGARPGTYRLADGTLLELARKDGRYGLQKIENGKGRGFTYLNGLRQVWQYGKAVVVLEHDGGFAAYIEGSAKQAAPQAVEKPAPAPAPERTPGPVVTVGACTVRQVVPSGFPGWKVTLTNDLAKGPKAVLTDDKGEVRGSVDRAHPTGGQGGLTIKGADTATPRFGQRTQGGDMPFSWTDFPKLPKGCAKDSAAPAPAPSATTGTGTGTQGGQTSVVPRGGVAAGAEFAPEGGSTTLVATGAGAAVLAAAGLGLVSLRRRTAAARG